jgi:hypothetical protein
MKRTGEEKGTLNAATWKKINGTWYRTGVWMLKGTSGGAMKDHYPICGELKNATNFIVEHLKSSNWGV